MARWHCLFFAVISIACGHAAPPPPPAPCFNVRTDSELRAADAQKTLDDLARSITLSPEDEALRTPKSLADIRAVLRRDVLYAFADAAVFARSLNTLDGRFAEAALELYLGDSQLIASQILNTQESWVGADLRMARANLAGEAATSDRGRMLAQLIRVVEEGNKIGDALGIVAPTHLARGAELIRALEKEAPNDLRTFALQAEYRRMRGEWQEFDAAMTAAEAADRGSPPLCYLRGMMILERFRRPDRGAEAMRGCLQKYPKFVRAQVALVLMATNPLESLRELEKLKEMNPDHWLVMLLEPTLAADRELWRMSGSRNADR